MAAKQYTVHPYYPNVKIAKEEEWRPVVGWEGSYEVSNRGRVRTITRNVRVRGGVRLAKSQLLKEDRSGRYSYVNLWRNNVKVRRGIHQLVLRMFVGRCPSGKETCHDNGNCRDNRLENLRYGTRKENLNDRHRHGTMTKGQHHGAATMTDAKAIEIKKTHAALLNGAKKLRNGELVQLAGKFNTTTGIIGSIVRGDRWSHLG